MSPACMLTSLTAVQFLKRVLAECAEENGMSLADISRETGMRMADAGKIIDNNPRSFTSIKTEQGVRLYRLA